MHEVILGAERISCRTAVLDCISCRWDQLRNSQVTKIQFPVAPRDGSRLLVKQNVKPGAKVNTAELLNVKTAGLI